MKLGQFRNDINPPDLSIIDTKDEEDMLYMMANWSI